MKNILGNDKVKKYLSNMIENGATWNSLLFAGSQSANKNLFAYAFAKAVICRTDPKNNHAHKIDSGNHPDIHIFKPEGKIGMHSIDSVRVLREEVHLNPNEAKRKVFIIQDAERMLPTSANALLKTFEEPPVGTLIILVSDYPDSILPTILSRCRKVLFEPVEEGVKNDNDPKREALLKLLFSFQKMNYGDLMLAIDDICSLMEEAKKEWQDESVELPNYENMSATQRKLIEKERDGFISLQWRREVDVLLDVIAFWYRDLHLVQSNADLEFIMHKDFLCEIKSYSHKLPTLEDVQAAIIDVKIAVQRSTQLKTCLESLFLKLSS